jgi:hypothetical protein
LQVIYDKTIKNANDLFADIDAEEQKAERERQKRKEKKYKAKLQKLAERDHCTVEETQRRLQGDKDAKQQKEY